MPASSPGIHHVTAITADVQKCVDFYVTVLGLRFIKKTVNFDVPDTYHIYFGDYVGTPGTAMTFFGWPQLHWAPQGAGQVLNVSFAVPESSLRYWSERLSALGVNARRETRFGRERLVFPDVDRIELELVGEASDERWLPWSESPVPEDHQIRGFHSVGLCVSDDEPSAHFLQDTFGFTLGAREANRIRFDTAGGGAGAIAEVIVSDAQRGEEATGTVHHVAWRAFDDNQQLAWRETLVDAGRQVTPVIERKYFRSIYFREPGGVLFEIATDKPGFTVDEPAEALGSGLQLPPQVEHTREALTFNLPPLEIPTPAPAAAR